MVKSFENRRAQQSFVSRGYHLFDLFGFEVKLDLSWLLLALLISWSLGAGWFPATYPGLSSYVYAWMGIVVAIGVFFSIVFHEFSHSIVARRFGMPIRGITLFIFGGVAEMEQEPESPRAEFLMAVAGPISSFLLALVLWLLEAVALAWALPSAVIGVLATLVTINLMVAIFNLVPAFPLDGGRMFRAVLWHYRQDLYSATNIASRFGRGFGLVLMVLGAVTFINGNLLGGMWWFVIGLFIRGVATSSYQTLILKDIVSDQPVRQFMRGDPVTVAPAISIAEWIEDYVYRHHYKMFPVVDGSRLLGCVTIDRIRSIDKSQWPQTTVGEILEPVSADNAVSADEDTMTLLPQMLQRGGRSRYMVVDDGKLVGIIALKDLLELLSLKLRIGPG